MPSQQVIEVETVILSIQVGTVTLALALTDVEEPDEARMDEIDADEPTPVQRARCSEVLDFHV